MSVRQDQSSLPTGVSVEAAEKASKASSKSKGRSKRNPFLHTLNAARRKFIGQIVRDAKTKRSAIEYILKTSDHYENGDFDVFKADFHDVVTNRLLDSRRFVHDCENLKVDPNNIAQHVVFDGNGKLNDVLTKGIEFVYGNELRNMSESIYSKQELEEAKAISPELKKA